MTPPRVPSPESRGIFVTGTDTGVGKTLVATLMLRAWAAHGLSTVGYKPVAAGCELDAAGRAVNGDALQLLAASTIAPSYEEVNPYALAAPIAPHLAAADEGVMLSLDRMVQGYRVLASRAERVVVEGAGGWSVPLDAERTLADLAVALELPVVLVVGLRLGCLNHALLTQAAIVASGLRFAAWVANTIDADMRERERNVDALQARLRAPCIGRIPDLRADGERGAPALDLDALAI